MNMQSSSAVLMASNRFAKSIKASRKQVPVTGSSSSATLLTSSNINGTKVVDIPLAATNVVNKTPGGNSLGSSMREALDVLIFCHSLSIHEIDVGAILKNLMKIYNFLKGSADAQDQLRNAGAYLLAAHLLLKFMSFPEICEPLLAITCLLHRQGQSVNSANFVQYINNLQPINVTEIIVTAMTQHLSVAAILLQGCRNVIQLSFNDAVTQNELCRIGICQILSTAFDTYHHSDGMIQQLCLVVVTISFNNLSSQFQLQEASIGNKLLQALERFIGNSELVVQILWAMRNMSHNNRDFCIQCGNLGGCELLMTVLRRHTSNPGVVEHALALLGNLANNNPANQVKFANAGTCEALIQYLGYFNSRKTSLELCFIAIGELATLPENRQKLVTRELVDISSSNLDSSHMTAIWCKFIGELCTDSVDVADKLGIMGACASVIAALKFHSDDMECFNYACTAVVKLSQHEDNISRFVNARIAKSFASTLMQCQNSRDAIPIISTIIEALDNLSSDKQFHRQLYDEGLEVLLVNVLTNFGREKAILESGSSMLTKLASNHIDSEMKLLNSGACEAILKITSLNAENEIVASLTCDTVSSMCFENIEVSRRFGSLGFCDNIMKMLNNFKSNPDILLKLCWSIENLVKDNLENQEKFHQLGFHPLLLKICQRFLTNEELVEHIFRVIFLLTSNKSTENFRRFNGNILCDLTFETLTKYMNNIDVVEYCCYVVSNLSSVQEYVMKLYDGGLYKVLLVILDSNFVNSRVMESCCWAISNLFREQNKVIDDFDKLETCKLMIKILNDPKSPTKVVAKACEVMADVYLDRENRSKLGLMASFEALRQVLNQYIDIEDVVYFGCFALLRVICYSAGNIEKFWRDGGQDAFLVIIKHHELNPRIVERILYCFSQIFEASGGTAIISSDLLDLVSTSMYFNMKNIAIVKQGIVVLSFAVDSYSNQSSGNSGVSSSGSVSPGKKTFGPCDLIVKLLKEHIGDRFIVESGLRSIAVVCSKSMENKTAFFKADVCDLINNALQQHILDGGIIESTGWVISKLCDGLPEAKVGLGPRACDLLIRAISQHIKYSSVVTTALLAIFSIADHPENKSHVDNIALFELILKALKSHRDHSGTVEQCCRVISAVASGSTSDTRYLRSNICEAILKVLEVHAFSVKLVLYITQALGVLVQCNRDNYRMVFYNLKGCPLLISALNNHINDEDVCSSGLTTLEIISTDCRENKVAFVTNGIFELINLILIQFGTGQKSSSKSGFDAQSNIIVQSLKLVSFMVGNNFSYQAQFIESGAARGVIVAMSNHIMNETVIQHGSKSIYLLTSHNTELQRIFWENAACEILVGALFRHISSIDTVANILLAIGSLSCELPEVVARFGEVGVCEMTIKAMKGLKANEAIAENGLLTISNCSYGNTSNTIKFCRSGVNFHVLRTLELFIHVPKIVGYAWGAVINLTSMAPSTRRSFVKDGIVNHIVNILDQHTDNEDIIELTLRVITNLCDGVDENQLKFSKENDFCKLLTDPMNTHIDKSRVIFQGLLAINAVQLNVHFSALNPEDYESVLACIRQSMDEHSTDSEIVKLGKKVLAKYNKPINSMANSNPGPSTYFSCCWPAGR